MPPQFDLLIFKQHSLPNQSHFSAFYGLFLQKHQKLKTFKTGTLWIFNNIKILNIQNMAGLRTLTIRLLISLKRTPMSRR